MKNKRIFLIVVLLVGAASRPAGAEEICERLEVGRLSDTAPPAPTPVPTPDVSKLAIQIYTTRALDFVEAETGGGFEHKCALAYDLAAVEAMMHDIGFEGFATGVAPLIDNAMVVHISDSGNAKQIREVAQAIQGPADVDPEEAVESLKENEELYNEHVMNLYFVHFPDVDLGNSSVETLPIEIRGMHLRNEDGDSEKIIFYGDGALPGTLVHEFGHALSAGHLNFWDLDGEEWCAKYLPELSSSDGLDDMECDFSRGNVMWAGSKIDRDKLKDPQKTRMMHNENSAIQEFSPSNNQINCPDNLSDSTCPRMQ
jgi:hypothetical protein